VISIHDPSGTRRLDEGDFPIALGGPEAAVPVPGAETTLGWLGRTDRGVFIQADEDSPLSIDGVRLTGSRWLRGGEVFETAEARIRVTAADRGFALRIEAVSGSRGIVLTPPPEPEEEGAITPIAFVPERATAGDHRRRRPLRALLIAIPLIGLVACAAYVFIAVPVDVTITPVPERYTIEGGLAPRLGGRYLLLPGDYTVRARREGYRPFERRISIDRETRVLDLALEKMPGLLAVATLDGAEISIDGKPAGTAPRPPLELVEGSHVVTITAPRHKTFTETVEIEGEGYRQSLVAPLEPLWSAVRITTEPSGTAVSVGGTELGRTPLEVDLDAGTHTLTYRRSGFQTVRARLRVPANQPLILPTVFLAPSDGNLVLESEPSGALVTVDGTFRGTTPLDLELPPGAPHEVTFSKAGYTPWGETVTLQPGNRTELSPTLSPVTGTLTLAIFPPDALVLLDGAPVNPEGNRLELTALPHRLEIRKPGYTVWKGEVHPVPGLAKRLDVTLKTTAQAERAATPSSYRDGQGHELHLIRPPERAFEMGASRREPGRRANEVLREVKLTKPYYLAAKEVTVAQFRVFENGHEPEPIGSVNLSGPDLPVTRVTWEQAAAYCNWLSDQEGLERFYVAEGESYAPREPETNGYRLPTEAEWAYAARYPGHREEPLKYPWGDSLPVAEKSANFADASASGLLSGTLNNYNDGYPGPAPPGSFGANAFDLFDMGGNVAEWVHDYYGTMMTPTEGVDPFGVAEGTYRIIRGSSWMHATITELRLSYRDYGKSARADVGFRVARYSE